MTIALLYNQYTLIKIFEKRKKGYVQQKSLENGGNRNNSRRKTCKYEEINSVLNNQWAKEKT
jgi:hypothetical protein